MLLSKKRLFRRDRLLSSNVKKYYVKEGLVLFLIALKLYFPNFKSSRISVKYFQYSSIKWILLYKLYAY